MNKVIWVLALLISASAFAIDCKFPSKNVGDFANFTLSIDNGKYSFVDANGENCGNGTVEETLLQRAMFENSSELQSYMTRSGIKATGNFLYAKLYITDSNSIGSSGLLVFFGGRGSVLAKSYILGPVDLVIKCK